MSELPAVVTALDELDRRIGAGSEIAEIALPLRALQLRGLSKLDLVVHVERMRAVNEAQGGDEAIDEACLVALDLIDGAAPGVGLSWNARGEARSLVPRCVSPDDVQRSLIFALTPSDLLPPRPLPADPENAISQELAARTVSAIETFGWTPVAASTFRVPKGPFTNRPAALLSLPDRVILETLTSFVEEALAPILNPNVSWPRNRRDGRTGDPQQAATNWGAAYIVRTDVAAFYENVEHATLALLLHRELGVNSIVARAIEALLDVLMGSNRGLPQGPPASDILATAYLVPLDNLLSSIAPTYARIADDVILPADSHVTGRHVIADIEDTLRTLGLTLQPHKTQVMRHGTFLRARAESRADVAAIRDAALKSLEGAIEAAEDDEFLETVLTEAGVSDDALWGLFYHHSLELDDVLPEVVSYRLASTYAKVIAQAAAALRAGTGQEIDDNALTRATIEALAVLSRHGEMQVAEGDLALICSWLPHLFPRVAAYLQIEIDVNSPSSVGAEFAVEVLGRSDIDDWSRAWGAYIGGLVSENDDTLISALRDAASREASSLSRAEAIRALGTRGVLNEAEWQEAIKAAPAAVQSEMLMSALAHDQTRPWAKRRLGELPPGA